MANLRHATLGGGCFWCVEAAFKEVPGVEEITSGYAGGETTDPTYEAVCRGETGHAEVVQLAYDPDVVGYRRLLDVFMSIHDPTQVDRQGPDVGSQYRSIILYHDENQRHVAEAFLAEIAADYADPIATEVTPLETFYSAEASHQDYFEKNPDDAYCRLHAAPKVDKVRQEYAGDVTGSAGQSSTD